MTDPTINTFSDEWVDRITRSVAKSERNLDATPNRRKRPPLQDDSTGTGGLFLFVLTEVDCANSAAIGTPLKAPCGVALPADNRYIVDDTGCKLTGNDALWIGRKCWCQYSEGDVYDCEWSIIDICCPDVICG